MQVGIHQLVAAIDLCQFHVHSGGSGSVLAVQGVGRNGDLRSLLARDDLILPWVDGEFLHRQRQVVVNGGEHRCHPWPALGDLHLQGHLVHRVLRALWPAILLVAVCDLNLIGFSAIRLQQIDDAVGTRHGELVALLHGKRGREPAHDPKTDSSCVRQFGEDLFHQLCIHSAQLATVVWEVNIVQRCVGFESK